MEAQKRGLFYHEGHEGGKEKKKLHDLHGE
jgi:hypothetical protein